MDQDKCFPHDYAPCGVCGFDHAYDLPNLDAEQRSSALFAHLSDHPIPPYEFFVIPVNSAAR